MDTLTIPEPIYESNEYPESNGREPVEVEKKTDIRKSVTQPRINVVGETRERWLTRNVINNYLMHCTR